MVVVGVSGSNVASAASTLTQSPGVAGEPQLRAEEAWQVAAEGGGIELATDKLDAAGRSDGFDRFDAEPLNAEQQVRLAALPMPGAAARRVYEVNVVDNGAAPVAFTAYVDLQTGEVIRRVNRLDQLADEPRWKYFESIPPLDGSDSDTRVLGCFPEVDTADISSGCDVDERSTEAGRAGAVGSARGRDAADLHDERQQRRHGPVAVQPADTQRSDRAANEPDARIHLAVHGRLAELGL